MTDAAKSAIVIDTPKGAATVVLTDGQNVTLHAPFAAPPGSPLVGVLRGTSSGLRIKVHGCIRITQDTKVNDGERYGDGLAREPRFEITGR